MLAETYEAGPMDAEGNYPDRDRIYLFGFSRGAYSARVLAGFIHGFGLTTKVHLNLLDYAYRAYKGITREEQARVDIEAEGDAPSAFPACGSTKRCCRTIARPSACSACSTRSPPSSSPANGARS